MPADHASDSHNNPEPVGDEALEAVSGGTFSNQMTVPETNWAKPWTV